MAGQRPATRTIPGKATPESCPPPAPAAEDSTDSAPEREEGTAVPTGSDTTPLPAPRPSTSPVANSRVRAEVDDRAVLQARESGLSWTEIADRFGINTAQRRADNAQQGGAPIHRTGPKVRSDVTDSDIVNARDEGQKWDEIAARFGMSRTGVRNRYRAATGQPRDRRTAPTPSQESS